MHTILLPLLSDLVILGKLGPDRQTGRQTTGGAFYIRGPPDMMSALEGEGVMEKRT